MPKRANQEPFAFLTTDPPVKRKERPLFEQNTTRTGKGAKEREDE